MKRVFQGIVNELNGDVGCGPYRLLVDGRDQVQGINIDELLEGLDGFLVRVTLEIIDESVVAPSERKPGIVIVKKWRREMSLKEKKTWRIVETDNHAGDYPDESFIAIGIPDEETAKLLANAWNDKWCKHDSSDRYAKVVEHVEIEYKLVPGFEP